MFVWMYVCTCVWMKGWMDACMDVCMHSPMFIWMCVWMHIWMYVFMHVYMHIHMYAFMCVCLNVCMYMWCVFLLSYTDDYICAIGCHFPYNPCKEGLLRTRLYTHACISFPFCVSSWVSFPEQRYCQCCRYSPEPSATGHTWGGIHFQGELFLQHVMGRTRNKLLEIWSDGLSLALGHRHGKQWTPGEAPGL